MTSILTEPMTAVQQRTPSTPQPVSLSPLDRFVSHFSRELGAEVSTLSSSVAELVKSNNFLPRQRVESTINALVDRAFQNVGLPPIYYSDPEMRTLQELADHIQEQTFRASKVEATRQFVQKQEEDQPIVRDSRGIPNLKYLGWQLQEAPKLARQIKKAFEPCIRALEKGAQYVDRDGAIAKAVNAVEEAVYLPRVIRHAVRIFDQSVKDYAKSLSLDIPRLRIALRSNEGLSRLKYGSESDQMTRFEIMQTIEDAGRAINQSKDNSSAVTLHKAQLEIDLKQAVSQYSVSERNRYLGDLSEILVSYFGMSIEPESESKLALSTERELELQATVDNTKSSTTSTTQAELSLTDYVDRPTKDVSEESTDLVGEEPQAVLIPRPEVATLKEPSVEPTTQLDATATLNEVPPNAFASRIEAEEVALPSEPEVVEMFEADPPAHEATPISDQEPSPHSELASPAVSAPSPVDIEFPIEATVQVERLVPMKPYPSEFISQDQIEKARVHSAPAPIKTTEFLVQTKARPSIFARVAGVLSFAKNVCSSLLESAAENIGKASSIISDRIRNLTKVELAGFNKDIKIHIASGLNVGEIEFQKRASIVDICDRYLGRIQQSGKFNQEKFLKEIYRAADGTYQTNIDGTSKAIVVTNRGSEILGPAALVDLMLLAKEDREALRQGAKRKNSDSKAYPETKTSATPIQFFTTTEPSSTKTNSVSTASIPVPPNAFLSVHMYRNEEAMWGRTDRKPNVNLWRNYFESQINSFEFSVQLKTALKNHLVQSLVAVQNGRPVSFQDGAKTIKEMFISEKYKPQFCYVEALAAGQPLSTINPGLIDPAAIVSRFAALIATR